MGFLGKQRIPAVREAVPHNRYPTPQEAWAGCVRVRHKFESEHSTLRHDVQHIRQILIRISTFAPAQSHKDGLTAAVRALSDSLYGAWVTRNFHPLSCMLVENSRCFRVRQMERHNRRDQCDIAA
jgi:hypothetical protein